MIGHTKARVLTGLLSLLLANLAMAQGGDSNPIYVGPFDVLPTLEVEVQQDDNLFRQTAGNETKSTLTLLRPAVSAVNDDGVVRYSFNYQLENGQYSTISNSDYTDHNLSAGMDWRVTVRQLLEFKTDINLGHDAHSEDRLTNETATDLDEYENQNFSVNYTLGTRESAGLLRVGYRYQNREYTTNRATTSFLDNDTQNVNVSLSLGTGVTSRIIGELSHGETDFSSNSLQNREEDRYSLGLEWRVTDLIDGEVRVGESTNKLINQASSTTSSTAEASIKWSPLTYSTVDFSLSKGVQNTTNNVGSYTDTRTQNITWNHSWNNVFSTQISYNMQDSDYVGQNRNDSLDSWRFGFNYAVLRWLDVGLSAGREEQNSSGASPGSSYNRNTTTLSLKGKI